MGFESFTVVLTPCTASPLRGGHDAASVAGLAADIQRHWPSLRPDDTERDEIACCPRPGDVFLFSETEAGLYQMLLEAAKEGNVDISLRFALCNPRTIHDPFCAMIGWLMRRYALKCHNFSGGRPSSDLEPFCDAAMVAERLTPSMDENRRLWQLDADTTEEWTWRPGDALAWFVKERCATPDQMQV